MAKEKIKVGDEDFEIDTETGEVTTFAEVRETLDWSNMKRARESYVVAMDRLDALLKDLKPGVKWDDIE